MGQNSKIEWTEMTWNPVTGCSKVSPGCKNCYAEVMAKRLRAMGQSKYQDVIDDRGRWTGVMRPDADALLAPMKRKKPTVYFVNSMSDLFHENLPFEEIDKVFRVMARCPHHTFQVLTKRPARMAEYLAGLTSGSAVDRLMKMQFYCDFHGAVLGYRTGVPLKNVWLGTSVENQETADERIPHLLKCPASVRFLSCEPLLGALDLRAYLDSGIHWTIVGGESGAGARPMHPDWARSIRDQCQEAMVPFFFKQWGEYAPCEVFDCPKMFGGRAYRPPGGGLASPVVRLPGKSGTFRAGTTRLLNPGEQTRCTFMVDNDCILVKVGKKNAGRLLDGREHNEMPD